MYTEFVVIYIGMGIIFIIQLITLGLLLALLIRVGKIQGKKNRMISASSSQRLKNPTVVFCSNCAAEFDGSEEICPKCGAVRR